MEIVGKLRDDILSNRVVLFLGAGVGQAAGLLGTRALSEYLYEKADCPEKLKKYKSDLSRLVAGLDADPNFTRQFSNKHLLDYFNDKSKYTNLTYHKKLLQLPCWKTIYTTNYDICLELAENSSQGHRLIPIVDAKDKTQLRSRDANKLKYFKIHGCAKILEWSPERAPYLVLTRRDFRESMDRKRPLLEELKNYLFDYQCSIVFLGFSVQHGENDVILANVQEVYDSIANTIHQPFRPVAVLKNVDDDTRFDLKHSDITLIEGTFENFIDEVGKILDNKSVATTSTTTTQEKIYITVDGNTLGFSKELSEQNFNQFSFYYDSYFEDKVSQANSIPKESLIDRWKTQPSDLFLATDRYIKRSQFDNLSQKFTSIIKDVQETKSSHILHVKGDRASGKSVIVKQLSRYAYEQLNVPVLFLNPNAVYTCEAENGQLIEIQGWNVRLIDKFLSQLHQEETENRLPVSILVADHQLHKQSSIDILLKYLENHNKPCVLLLTSNISTSSETQSLQERIFDLYKKVDIIINKNLDNFEIEELFNSVRRDRPEIETRKQFLIEKAKIDCHRDLLFILYTWFDNNYRKLEEIIIEESEKLTQQKDSLRELYLTVALFHQYNYSPRISLCAEAQDINIADFYNLNTTPLFKAFLKLTIAPDDTDRTEHLVFTRHPEFARRVVRHLLANPDDQIKYMVKVLQCAKLSDLQFIQDFLIMVFTSHETSFNIAQVTKLKEASEKRFANDWVLNHQFGAYLIRENTKLEEARYYLDKALTEVDNEISKSSIIHSLGNLKFAMHRTESDRTKALIHYREAEDYFAISRTLRSVPEEHGYVTNIDLISFRLDNEILEEKKQARLVGKKNSLIFEALTVVPPKRQNYLLRRIQSGGASSFSKLSPKYREILLEDIKQGHATPLLLDYYLRDLLSRPKNKTWIKIKLVIDQYSKHNDAATMIVIALASKKAFVTRADNRFEKLRLYFERVIKTQEEKISFILVAEYIRLLMVDAIVLNKFDYLKSILPETLAVFRDFKPRFLVNEYILPNEYYLFDQDNDSIRKKLFSQKHKDFTDPSKGKRYIQNIKKMWNFNNRYFPIVMDVPCGFFIKGFRQELPYFSSNITIEFSIKYTYEGFIGYNINS